MAHNNHKIQYQTKRIRDFYEFSQKKIWTMAKTKNSPAATATSQTGTKRKHETKPGKFLLFF